MSFTFDHWTKRIAHRTDLTSSLVHVTRGRKINGEFKDGIEILYKILREKKLEGSKTEIGFICGGRKAVCFQDVPLYALCQNIYSDEDYRRYNPDAKVRYLGVGLMLPKTYVFNKGGRPVIYDRKDEAKLYLPKDEWWRIVNFDLSSNESFVDWTHEREWRVPDSLSFELSQITVLVSCPRAYELLMKRSEKEKNKHILNEVRGIVCLGAIFF